MKYVFVLVFILVYVFFGSELGYTNTSPFYTHITYLFQHAGLIHLMVNSLAFVGIFRATERLISKWILILASLTGGFLLSFLAADDLPTVGASGMIYMMTGLYVGITAFSNGIKILNLRKYVIFLTTVVIALTVSSLSKTSNHILHSLSFLTGIFIYACCRLIKEMRFPDGRRIFK